MRRAIAHMAIGSLMLLGFTCPLAAQDIPADTEPLQWRSDEGDQAGRVFSFLGLRIGQPLREAQRVFTFSQCRSQRGVQWGAIPSAGAVLIAYLVDENIGAMQYYFPPKRTAEVREKLLETYGKPTRRQPPQRTGGATVLEWNTPSGVMRFVPGIANKNGGVIINADYLERVLLPGRVDCSDMAVYELQKLSPEQPASR